MKYEQEDTIELGVVSADTKGVIGTENDFEAGQKLLPGLSDD